MSHNLGLLVFINFAQKDQRLETINTAGKILWRAVHGFEFIGEGKEEWDEVAIVQFSNAQTRQQMIEAFKKFKFRDLSIYTIQIIPQMKLRLYKFLMRYILSKKSIDLTPRDSDPESVFTNPLFPSRKQWNRFLNQQPSEPAVMFNFLKYYPNAQYSENSGVNHKKLTQISGEKAYMRYSKEIMKLLAPLGACVEQVGQIEAQVIGESENSTKWDQIGVMRYPSPTVFSQLFHLKVAATKGEIHRDAGLMKTKNIAFKPYP